MVAAVLNFASDKTANTTYRWIDLAVYEGPVCGVC